jgi:hypothetical protein
VKISRINDEFLEYLAASLRGLKNDSKSPEEENITGIMDIPGKLNHQHEINTILNMAMIQHNKI